MQGESTQEDFLPSDEERVLQATVSGLNAVMRTHPVLQEMLERQRSTQSALRRIEDRQLRLEKALNAKKTRR